MLRRISIDFVIPAILVVVSAFPLSYVAAEENPKSTSASAAEAGSTAAKNPFAVPDGTIDELQKYIEGLSDIYPSSSLPAATLELHRKRADAQVQACEKILAAKATPDQAQAAVRMKLAALGVLARLGDGTAQSRLEATLDQVEKLGLKDMKREVQLAALQSRALQAMSMRDDDYDRFVERLTGFLKDGPIEAGAARLAVDVALAAERSDRPALANHAYRQLAQVLAAAKDEKLAGTAPTAAAMLGAARRLELLGKPFVLDGSTVGGQPLDWSKYRGKIVLIDFFATWCGPCRDELPKIVKCYQDYHTRGFDVIGVSIDRDRKAIEDYVERENHPWTILLDHSEARGSDKSLATYYGILALPQMILVGNDGEVLALNVRGKQLGEKLETFLGPAQNGKETTKK